MHRRAVSINESLRSCDDMNHGLECRRTSRHYQKSKFATENPLSSQASQGLKLGDKVVKAENSICPPHWDVPFEFVKNAYNVLDVHSRSSGSEHHPRVSKGVGKEEELVKYMSKVPDYLQKGEKVQDKVFNIGVLDWGRLEKWTVNNEKTLVSERITRPSGASCSSASDCVSDTEALFRHGEKPSLSNAVDFSPVVQPLCGEARNLTGLQTSSCSLINHMSETFREETHRKRDPVNSKSVHCKEKHLSQESSSLSGKSSSDVSKYDNEILDSMNRKLGRSDSETLKCSQNIEGLGQDTPHQNYSGKVVSNVLLPKEFSGLESSEVHHRSSLDGKSGEHDWGSFSDIFSIYDIQSNESDSKINLSSILNYAVQNEKELDFKLDTLIKAQGFQTPVHLSGMTLNSDENKIEAVTGSSAGITGDILRNQQSRFGIARMTKSLSFREGSRQPPVNCTYVTVKSGPAKPGCSTSGESETSNNANIDSRASASPLRRLLDPLLKSKLANRLCEQSNYLKKKPSIPVQLVENEKHEASTIKALLHLSSVNSGLPLFKFVVEFNNEIFASTVKSLSSIRRDGVSWLYTFYSVHKVRKRNSGWKNQKVSSGFGYNVVGQMKVSNSYSSSWCEQESKERHMVIESVLYNVDVNKVDASTSELKTTRELAAIVVNMSDTAGKRRNCCDEYSLDDWFSDLDHDKVDHIVVLLPGADHSLPHEGVPSSLINRWRSGGSCDCGGWDIGCKLRILTDKWQHDKVLQAQCDLYDQGEAKQCKPFFSLIPLRDGLFSVEFDAKLTSLQAFSISVALINRQKLAHSANATDQFTMKQDFKSLKASMAIKSEGPEKHAPHPPLSPVGRV